MIDKFLFRSVQLTFRVIDLLFFLLRSFYWPHLIACRVEGGNVAVDLELGSLDSVPTSNVPTANE